MSEPMMRGGRRTTASILDGYRQALTDAETEIVAHEDTIAELRALNTQLRERLWFVERELAFRRTVSSLFTIVGKPATDSERN